jgi:hypothetical protein
MTVAAVLAVYAVCTGGTDAVRRVQRLLVPAEPLSRVHRHLLRAGAAALGRIQPM